MSSATPSNPAGVRRLINLVGDAMSSAAGSGRPDARALSKRQQRLDWFWRFYRTQQYEGRKVDWDGREAMDGLEQEVVARAGFVPTGFIEYETTPLKFRRPTAPYHLARVIVDRFTGMLFSTGKHPAVTVPGDEATQDWLVAAIEAMRLWARFAHARGFGGAMGAVGVGFKVLDGAPHAEVFDPRDCLPELAEDGSGRVERLVIQRLFVVEERNERGEWVDVEYLYRRVLDDELDQVWPKVKVPRNGEEPNWSSAASEIVAHGFGECPVVWIPNVPVEGELDGDPDLLGCFNTIEAMDRLVAEADAGIIKNCDPTLFLATAVKLDEIQKGSDSAIQLEQGARAEYLEIAGSGPRAALELADRYEDRIYRMARMVPEWRNSSTTGRRVAARTATEVEREMGAMWERADQFREQYGEMGVKRFLEMVLRIARRLEEPVEMADPETGLPQMVRREIRLPPKVEKTEGGGARLVARTLGPPTEFGDYIQLRWPPYQKPALEDAVNAASAATTARAGKLLDQRQALEFVAPFFQVEDVDQMEANLAEEKEQNMADMESQMLAGAEAKLNAGDANDDTSDEEEQDDG